MLMLSLLLPNVLYARVSMSASLLKAVYTYKFANFTQWPESAENQQPPDIKMCVIGDSPFSTAELAQIIGKPVKKKKLTIQVFQRGVISADSLQQCAIAYISVSEKQRLALILAALQSFPVLTVSDIEGFSELGGMITLVQSQQRIRFQINQQTVESAGLLISSKILEMSQLVGR